MHLTLKKVCNGGWIISAGPEPGYLGVQRAYSTTEDMMRGLEEIVYPQHVIDQGQGTRQEPDDAVA